MSRRLSRLAVIRAECPKSSLRIADNMSATNLRDEKWLVVFMVQRIERDRPIRGAYDCRP